MRTASHAKLGGLPNSLRDRLALLEWGVKPVPPPRVRAGAAQGRGRPARRFARASFLVGVACGGALGSTTLLLALFAYPEQVQTSLRHVLALPEAVSRLAQLPPAAHRRHGGAPSSAPTQSSFEMILARGGDGKARLPLRIDGVDTSHNAAESVQVLLRGLPDSAALSRGARRDAGTWALRLAEIEELYLTLAEGAPEAFAVTVEVASAAGTSMARAVAHVRVLPQQQAVQASTLAAADLDRKQAPPPASQSAPVLHKPFRTELNAIAQLAPPAPPASPRAPPPEGMSSLGGPSGSASPAPPAQEGRTVWWKLPPPAWSPFANDHGSN